MQAHWWGILGLIGWSYLIAAIVFLFWGHSYWLIGAAWAFLALFNIAEFAGFLSVFSDIKVYVWIVSSGFLFWIVDIKEKRQWWKPIGHAGTATLTCYLAPYIYYAIGGSLGLELPVFCAKEF
jgi:glucan phosphoethanolaminetransferase (alkaline phosphatase superfamily)